MGKGETPARVRAVLLPPRPAARAEPVVDRTQLRSREESPHEEGMLEGPAPVSTAMAAAAHASSSAPEGESPPVAPLPLDPVSLLPVSVPAASPPPASPQPVPRHLLDCRVSVIPRLPVVNLEKPNSNWPDLTPSPVPRVSLVPPTGRLEPSQLPSFADSRNLPTVAPRTRALTPALTLPRLSKPAREGRLSRRLARDLRSSKREIAFGLGIGIGLSFVLGRLGQSYLESRSARHGGPLEAWTASSLPSAEPHAPLASAPPPSPAPSNANLPNAVLPSGSLPSPSPPAPAAPALAAPSAAGAEVARRAGVPLAAAHPPRNSRPARRQAPSAARRSDVASDGPSEAPLDELEPHGKSPLSPSESAGLGRELPL